MAAPLVGKDVPTLGTIKSTMYAGLDTSDATGWLNGASHETLRTGQNQPRRDNPNDTKNLYAMANLYERFGRVPEAEQTYVKVTEQNPTDAKACGALAAFYNKPLWDDAGAVWVDTGLDLTAEVIKRLDAARPAAAAPAKK